MEITEKVDGEVRYPDDPHGSREIFTGLFGGYAVRWIEDYDPATEFTITNNVNKNECDARTQLFLNSKYVFYSQASGVLAISERAASSEDIVFYSVDSCERLAAADISTYEEVNSTRIIDKGYCKFGEDCDGKTALCYPATMYVPDKNCLTHEDKESSRKYTKETYGVEFDKETLIQSPKSNDAKIVEKK